MRSPAEIMGEHSNDEWTAYDWKCVHDAIRAAQLEALEETKYDAAHVALREIRQACDDWLEGAGMPEFANYQVIIGMAKRGLGEK